MHKHTFLILSLAMCVSCTSPGDDSMTDGVLDSGQNEEVFDMSSDLDQRDDGGDCQYLLQGYIYDEGRDCFTFTQREYPCSDFMGMGENIVAYYVDELGACWYLGRNYAPQSWFPQDGASEKRCRATFFSVDRVCG